MHFAKFGEHLTRDGFLLYQLGAKFRREIANDDQENRQHHDPKDEL